MNAKFSDRVYDGEAGFRIRHQQRHRCIIFKPLFVNTVYSNFVVCCLPVFLNTYNENVWGGWNAPTPQMHIQTNVHNYK